MNKKKEFKKNYIKIKVKKGIYSNFLDIAKITPNKVVTTTIQPKIIVTLRGIHLIDKFPSIIPKPTANETTMPVNQIRKFRSLPNVVKSSFFFAISLPPFSLFLYNLHKEISFK